MLDALATLGLPTALESVAEPLLDALTTATVRLPAAFSCRTALVAELLLDALATLGLPTALAESWLDVLAALKYGTLFGAAVNCSLVAHSSSCAFSGDSCSASIC